MSIKAPYLLVSDIELGGPIIIPNKSEITLKKGQNYTIFCKSNYSVKIEQQETPEEIVEPFRKIQRNVTSSDNMYKYEIALDLYNVNQFAVGYYACYDNTINGSDIFKNMLDEPANTKHISYIYIYVDGEAYITFLSSITFLNFDIFHLYSY